MPEAAKAGRPPKTSPALTKDAILQAALPIVTHGSVQALSFRAIAAELGVTAMAVTYHCGNKKQLLADLVELAFRGTLNGINAEDGPTRARAILKAYCHRAMGNANLLRAVLEDTSLMSHDLHAVTDALRAEIHNQGDDTDTLVHLLIDYTHGFVLSAASGQDNPLIIEDYLPGIDWMLSRL